jgi:predicted dehydrogenase
VATTDGRDRDAIRVGLIGFGLAGEVFHAPLIAATPELELGSIVTSDAGRRERARASYPRASVVPNVDDLWSAASELDLVVIAAPNSAHVPLARRALEAGLAVVIDKPMAPTSAESQRLIDEAEARGLLLTVFQNRRWDGDYLDAAAAARGGRARRGRTVRVAVRALAAGGQPDAWRERAEPDQAGGLLFDLGAHLIDRRCRRSDRRRRSTPRSSAAGPAPRSTTTPSWRSGTRAGPSATCG